MNNISLFYNSSNIVSTANSVFLHVFIYICIYLTASSIVISLNDIKIINNVKRQFVLIYLSLLMNNALLLLLSLFLTSNRLIIFHYILIIISIISNNIEVLIICLDLISMLNIILILTGSNIWYYMLYQSLLSLFLWYSYTGSFYLILIYLYYNKLGLGIGGYSIPGLYSSMMNKLSLMIYIGIGNIILMYKPILLSLSSNYLLLMFNVLIVLIIICLWISSGYLYMDIWLYTLSFSTLILSNIYYFFSSIDVVSYNLYYYLYYFTISSMIIWFVLVYILSYFNTNNNSSSSILLILGFLLLNRSIFGLLLISFSVLIFLLSNGYILICLLISINIISISLIILVLYYNNLSSSSSVNNLGLLLCILYTLFVSSNCNVSIPYHSSLSYVVILNSNILLSLLIFCLLLFVICLYRLNTGLSYQYIFLLSFMMLDIYLLLIVSLLICYIPIVIRNSSSISKWSSDIYSVGIGVSNSNSLYMSLGSLNVGSYLFTYMIYIFVVLDLMINLIILSNLFYSNIFLTNIIIMSTLLSLYALLSNSSNNNSNNSSSIYSLLYLLIILLIVLSLSSLLTVLERKVLGSSQRRLGPSYNGWFGLIQIVMDGIKLVYKDYMTHNNINNKYILLSSVMSFVLSYVLFVLIYFDLYCNISISYLLLLMLVILMLNHIGILYCGLVISNSKWTILSSIRLVLLYIQYDILFILIIVYLDSSNLNNYISVNSIYMNSLKYPILFLIYIYIVLMEAGRIPIDLIEAESELISGYSIEYSGFSYALFASAEYSIILFHSCIMSIIFTSSYNNILMILLLFIIFVIIRSTLPRLKYTYLYNMMYYYVIGIVLLYLIINLSTVLIVLLLYVIFITLGSNTLGSSNSNNNNSISLFSSKNVSM